jgi:type III secretion system YscD/HrpQ family protein
MSKGRLIARSGSAQGSVFTLDEGTQWILGRDPEQSQITLEDSHTSRKHAKISLTSDGFLIENLSSTNTLEVNDLDITEPYLLKEEDIIKIGSNTLLYTTKSSEELDLEEKTAPPSQNEEESKHLDTIFKEEDDEDEISTATIHFDFLDEGRWLIKILTGPNQGAENYLEEERDYIVGKDEKNCDIVLQDLSISQKHASLRVSIDNKFTIKDLGSRNGTFVESKRIKEETEVAPNQVIFLGTTSFLLIDTENAQETVISPNTAGEIAEKEEALETLSKEKEQIIENEKKQSLKANSQIEGLETQLTVAKQQKKKAWNASFMIAGTIIAFAYLVFSLFSSQDVTPKRIDYEQEIALYIRDFSEVTFKFNKATGQIFLLGHVLTQEEHDELTYNLKELSFIKEFNNHIVIDEGVWQEMNQILGKNDNWRGINVYAPQVGHFAVTGYLQERKEFEDLNTFINLNFTYDVENQVIVEEDLIINISGHLIENGFVEVSFDVSNGDLTLTGFLASKHKERFNQLIQSFKKIEGIRMVKNFVVELALDESRLDLTDRYKITGYTKKDNVLNNVIINGQILSIGDGIDGMTITDILPKMIYLEKGSLKYKIDYNH